MTRFDLIVAALLALAIADLARIARRRLSYHRKDHQ